MAYLQNPGQEDIVYKGDKQTDTPLSWAEMDTNLYILSSSISTGGPPLKIAQTLTTDQVVGNITYNSQGLSPQPSAVLISVKALGFENPQFRLQGTLFGISVNFPYSAGDPSGDNFVKNFIVPARTNVSTYVPQGQTDSQSQLTVTAREGTDDATATSNTYTISVTRQSEFIMEGTGGITVELLNRTTVVPVNLFGDPKDLTQTTNQLGVFEGVNTLQYVNNVGSLVPGSWTIASIDDVNIQVGTQGQAGNFLTFGQVNVDNTDFGLSANITFTVTGSALDGTAFLRTAVQTFTFAVDSPEGQVGPGVVYRGLWSPDKIYYQTDIRRDVVKNGNLNEYYVVNNAALSEELGSVWGQPSGSTNWSFLGSQVDFVATDILLAQDAYIDKTLNVGSTAAGAAKIALVGGAVFPYISLGQTDNVFSQGYGLPGIFLGYSGSNSIGRFTIISGSGQSQKGLIWDGNNLIIKGAIRQNDAGDPLTEFNFRGPWETGLNYEKADVVVYTDQDLSGSLWFCKENHLSSNTNEPTVGATYQNVWVPFTLPGTQGVGYSVFLSRRLVILGKDEEDNLVFTNSGTSIIALKNGQVMAPVVGGNPNTLAANQFTVTTGLLSGILSNQIGTFSQVGSTFVVGNHTALSSSNTETANIEYKIYFGGVIEPVAETQVLTVPLRGADGDVGPGVVFRGDYSSTDFYYYTEERRDIVKYSVGGSNYWLVNVKTTEPAGISGAALGLPGAGNTNWRAFGAEFSSVATDILLAKDATITRGLVMGTSGSFSGFIRSVGANTLTNGKGFYMDVSGSARFGDPTSQQIFWNDTTGKLNITGSVKVGPISLNGDTGIISTGLLENQLANVDTAPVQEGGLYITPSRVWQAKRNTTGTPAQLGSAYLNVNLATTSSAESKFEAVSSISGSGAIRILQSNDITLTSRGFDSTDGGSVVINTNSTQAVTDPTAGVNSKGILQLRTVPLIGSGSTQYYLPYAAGTSAELAPVGSTLTITNSSSENNLTEFVPRVTSTASSTIQFDRSRIFGTATAPRTDSLTPNLSNAQLGIIQKIYHQAATFTPPAGWVKLGGGNYVGGQLNIIYAEFAGGNRVEYWIVN
jgi:hypothetical protein